ncbi:permease [Polycladidibacter stylochi]|uniref:permease n=1 Tax=Polycladidibacter stylochi TaxID=1807766 RepID=UPI0009E7950B|nr:permease [Pseudovibrio stylochi]
MTTTNTDNKSRLNETVKNLRLLIYGLLALTLWFIVYWNLNDAATWLTLAMRFTPNTHIFDALQFFLYDTPKVIMLLSLVVFAMGVVRSYFSAERTRALLSGKRQGFGNIAAACLGIVTPFCSCSAVPLFIGFVSANVPLGVTFSFLIAAPMVNEIAIGLLFALVGWKVALAYLLFGLTIAIVAGMVIGRLNLEHWLEPWVLELRSSHATAAEIKLTLQQRMQAGIDALKDILGKVWKWILLGIAVGAFIHGFVPADLLSTIMGKDAWWSVPGAVLLGVPMYSNAAGIIPVVEALIGKGAALGTVLAFMMSVIALSLPEMIILRKVLSVKLILVFVGVVASGILATGFIFNLLFA